VDPLREGFATFLYSPAALPAMGIGVLYECLFIFGTLIYLDPNPSRGRFDQPLLQPSCRGRRLLCSCRRLPRRREEPARGGPDGGTCADVLAIIMLSYPAIKRLGAPPHIADKVEPRLLLFICGGTPAVPLWPRPWLARRSRWHGRGATFGLPARRDGQTVGAPMPREALIALESWE